MTFNPAAAMTAAKRCKAAYEGPNVIDNNAQALVLPDCTAIPGTNDGEDVKQDAKILGSADLGQGAEVHRGFLAHYRTLAARLFASMQANQATPPDTSTGHSIGAAVLVLCIWHRPHMFKGATVFLFGCPVVGNAEFAAMFAMICRDNGITVWNVQGRGDPVPTETPGRDHVGHVVKIGAAIDGRADHPIRSYIRDLEAMV